jgi:hypothetical protein
MPASLSFDSPDFLDRIRLPGSPAEVRSRRFGRASLKSASTLGDSGGGHFLTFTGAFVRPISMVWLGKAAEVSHSAALVGVVLWYLSGLRRSATIPLTHASLALLHLDRHASKRLLPALERAGLVSIERHVGRAHLVTIRTDTLPLPAPSTFRTAPRRSP